MKLTGKILQKGDQKNTDDYPHGHHKLQRIWVLLADDHLARLFKKNAHGIEMCGEIKPSHTDWKSGPNGPSGKMALVFAQEIAQWLDQSVHDNAFDRLVLIAAPRTLGELRKALTTPVQNRIMAEIDKDLTKMGAHDLQQELEKIVWF